MPNFPWHDMTTAPRDGTAVEVRHGPYLMRRLLALMVAVTSLCLHQPGYCFTQVECDQLAKAQADPAGRQMVEKMQVDAKGNCVPEPPADKRPETQSQKQPQSPNPSR
jgi:hypothetical protein